MFVVEYLFEVFIRLDICISDIHIVTGEKDIAKFVFVIFWQ